MRLRYLNPFWIRDTVRDAHGVVADGGPRAIRLTGVEGPDGWLVPTAQPTIEFVGRRHGKISRFQPALPVPWMAALAWRLARRIL